MRDNKHEPQQERFRGAIKKMFSCDSHLLEDEPRQVVGSQALAVFKTQTGKLNWSALSIHPAWDRRLD